MLNLNESCGSPQLDNLFLDCVKSNSLANSPNSVSSIQFKSNSYQNKTSIDLGSRSLSLRPAPEGFEEVREAIARLRVEALDAEELAAATLGDWREVQP